MATLAAACHDNTSGPSNVQRGALWVANNNGTSISGFTVAQLGASGSPTPGDAIGGIDSTAGLVLDAAGNMWVSSFSSDTLRMYTAAQRTGSGSPTPTVTIVSPSLIHPEQLAIDANGTLWVADFDNGLIGFTKSQLGTSGTVTAAFVVTDTTVSNARTYAAAFDRSGNAWVVAVAANHVSEYAPSQLAASGSPVPTAVLTANNGSLGQPVAATFDASGNLWVANFQHTVVEFTPSQLGASGSPVPAVAITLPSGGTPFGLAFDAHGTLWVSDAHNSAVVGIPSAQQTTGTPASPIVLTASAGSLSVPEQVLFDAQAQH